MSAHPKFQIGLALAGGTSAGAYSAGVVDFLIEALDTWARHQGTDHDGVKVPALDVQISSVAGASAGGICASILAATADLSYPPARADGDRSKWNLNPFYHTWVNELDISQFLGTNDLPQDKNTGSIADNPTKKDVLSVLDSSRLTKIAEGVIDFRTARSRNPEPEITPRTGEDQRGRDWLADPFALHLTVTNLRGVPHGVRFQSLAGKDHVYVRHADHITFEVPVFAPKTDTPFDDLAVRLPLTRTIEEGPMDLVGRRDSWSFFVRAALATSSFPIVLEARHLSNPSAVYDRRLDDLAAHQGLARTVDGIETVRVWPDTNSEPRPEPVHEFFAVDGGVMNNEPLGLLEQDFARIAALEGFTDDEHLNHAIVMIDPFTDVRGLPGLPGSRNDDAQTGTGEPDEDRLAFLTVAGQLVGALLGQSRFQTEDLIAAMQESQPHRFLVAPARGALSGDKAITGGEVGTFMGFVHANFRRHDFFLGRRNCQAFLHNYFKLPKDHPLIRHRLASADKKTWTDLTAREGNSFSIVPLLGGLDKEIEAPEWPVAAAFHASAPADKSPDLDRLDPVYREALEQTCEEFKTRLTAFIEATKKAATAQDKGFLNTLEEVISRVAISVVGGPTIEVIKLALVKALREAIVQGYRNLSERADMAAVTRDGPSPQR